MANVAGQEGVWRCRLESCTHRLLRCHAIKQGAVKEHILKALSSTSGLEDVPVTKDQDLESFFQELEHAGLLDDTNVKLVTDAAKACCPEALPAMSRDFHRDATRDLVGDYLERVTPLQQSDFKMKRQGTKRPRRKRRVERQRYAGDKYAGGMPPGGVTVNLQVHLWGSRRQLDDLIRSVSSLTLDPPIDQQLERFSHMATLTDHANYYKTYSWFKFTRLVHLDAFWRLYLDGSLKQIMTGHLHGFWRYEVYINEQEYLRARKRLLEKITGRI